MQLDILAFGAHPDDVELFAGGTLAKMAACGYATGVVDMTQGEFGSRGSAAVRAQEAEEAARILGLKVRENLGLPDGNVQVTPEARLEVVRILRKYRPLVVLVHYWEDRHSDHVNTSRLVSEAAHHAGLAKMQTGQDRFRPRALLYFKLPPHVIPSLIVDVSDHVEKRAGAIQAYRSQLFNPASREPATYLSQPDFLSRVESVTSYYGGLVGKMKGEGFFIRGILEAVDLVDLFRKQNSNRFH